MALPIGGIKSSTPVIGTSGGGGSTSFSTQENQSSTTSGTSGTLVQTTANIALDQPGIIEFTYGLADIAINLTNSQLYRIIPSASSIGAQVGAVLPSRGSIIGMTFAASANKTAGTATFTAYVAGTATGATLSWGNSVAAGQTLYAKGTYPFAAGDTLDVRITTDASFAPAASNDVIVMLYCYMDPTTTV